MRCPICLSKIQPGAKLCAECGATINRVTRRIEAGNQQGQLIEASVLCAGVEGYIRLCEKLPLLEVSAIVNEYLERLLPTIERFGGKLDSFNGEKILAVFSHPDKTQAAKNSLHCAFKLHQVFVMFWQELLESYARDLELELRVGIASGEILVSTLGVSGQAGYFYHPATIGDAVNYAFQLEYEARPGHIITDQATFEQAADTFDFAPVGKRTLRRRSTPIALFDVIGPKKVEAKLTESEPITNQVKANPTDVLI